MGRLSKYTSASKLVVEPCDIIEFNRLTYSHYAFYIGDGICVQVSGPSGSSFSSPSSSSSSSSTSCGTKSAELLITIAGSSPCRVNNQEMVQTLKQVSRREKTEAIALATKGLPRDSDGKLILGKGIKINYSVISNNNCEGWATHWRYNCQGWSHQAVNGVISSTFGTTERLFECVVSRMEDVLEDEEDTVKRVAAATGAVIYKTAAIITTSVTRTADFLTGLLLSTDK